MSIEQKIREILSESTEELSEGSRGKTTYTLPAGRAGNVKKASRAVDLMKQYLNQNDIRFSERHHEGGDEVGSENDPVNLYYLSPNRRGQGPRPAEVSVDNKLLKHKEHGPFLKKLLDPAQAAAYNEPDWMDEDVDYGELLEGSPELTNLERARRAHARANADYGDAEAEEKEAYSTPPRGEPDHERQSKASYAVRDARERSKKTYKDLDAAEKAMKARMDQYYKDQGPEEAEESFDFLDAEQLFENIDRSVELYEDLVENANSLSDDDVVSAITEVIELLPQELATEWFSTAGYDLDDDDWSNLCESLDVLDDEGVLEEGLGSFIKGIGRGVGHAINAIDSSSAALRDKLKSKVAGMRASGNERLDRVTTGISNKLADATGTDRSGPSKFAAKAGKLRERERDLRVQSGEHKIAAKRSMLGGLQTAVNRLRGTESKPASDTEMRRRSVSSDMSARREKALNTLKATAAKPKATEPTSSASSESSSTADKYAHLNRNRGIEPGRANRGPSVNLRRQSGPRGRMNSSYEYEDGEVLKETNMQDYVNALTNGEELTEEFKEKAATIFEAAVVSRVNEELVNIQEAYEAQLEEEVTSITEGLIEKVDGYLDYVVEQWMEQNEIALERGMKSEILENFVSGLKNLFEENYIDLPEEKFDVLGSMEEKIEELTSDLNEQMERNVNMKKEIATYQVAQILSETSEGLAATDKDKFLSLVEELEFEDVNSFARKAQIIRESYFTNKKVTSKSTVQSVVSDAPVYLDEETNYVDPSMRGYVSVLDKLK